MSNTMASRGLLTSATAVLITSCGGGGGSAVGGSAGIDGTGQPAQITAVGTITAFGSVVVNGVRYDTSSARFIIDGEPGVQSDLAVGQIVRVRGSLDDGSTSDGRAETIVFDDNVEGPIESIDVASRTFEVLGQTIRVTADTSFDDRLEPASFDGLTLGGVVEVSGFVASDGSISAARIEPKPAGGDLEVTGRISVLDAASLTFSINALTVDYSAATLEDFPGGAPQSGDVVEVKGRAFTADGALLANRVELKRADAGAAAGDRMEVEGFITRFGSASDFDVAGIRVRTTASTRFEGGSSADLGLDIKIEAEGSLDGDGVLVATEIDIRRSRAVRAAATVDSVDAAGGSFVVLGIPVDTDALTRIEDKSSQDVEPFGIGDLAVGDYVELRGMEFPADSGRILAGIVEREDADSETELQGFVTDIAQPAFEILGVTIWTDAQTVFRDAAGASLGSAAFFADLEEGDLVKADGVEIGDRSIAADEVELEIE